MEHRADNPCDRIGPVLGPQRDTVRHMRALPHSEVASAIGAVRASKATRAVKLAFEFLVLTAARSGEVRLATWDEIDMAGRVWTVPATRMKMNREHRVPLSGRAVEVLDAARTLADGNPLVFPNRWGNSIKDTFLSQLLKDLRVAAVPHGFRSSFRDWGGGGDRPPARGHRGGAGACGPQPGRGGVRPLGPVRAAAGADGRLGGLSRPDGRTGNALSVSPAPGGAPPTGRDPPRSRTTYGRSAAPAPNSILALEFGPESHPASRATAAKRPCLLAQSQCSATAAARDCAGGSAGSDPGKTCGFAALWAFLRHTRRAGSLPAKLSRPGSGQPLDASEFSAPSDQAVGRLGLRRPGDRPALTRGPSLGTGSPEAASCSPARPGPDRGDRTS